jgi:hypothetical protein
MSTQTLRLADLPPLVLHCIAFNWPLSLRHIWRKPHASSGMKAGFTAAAPQGSGVSGGHSPMVSLKRAFAHHT